MKKITAFLLCVLMTVSLAACSGSPDQQTSAQAQPTAAPNQAAAADPAETKDPVEEYVDVIPFVKDGEIYFDLHVTDAIKNFTVKVDGTAVDAAGKRAAFTKDSRITFEGEADADKAVSVYIVFGMKEEQHYRFNTSISKAMDADRALERLPKLMSDVLGGNAKILVIITEQPQDWDHTLDDKLNEYLNQYIGD